VLRRDGLDTRADLSEAAVWFRRAAELGDGEAQAAIAELYAEGRGVERNSVEALIWAEAAAPSNAQAAILRDRLAENLPAASQAEAWYRMAAMALAHEEAERDEAAISTAFRRAGELGHPQAMRRLALRYLEGTGVERDWAAAASWLRRAAEAGNMESGLAYAAMVFAGEGVPRDPARALAWARRAAEAGIAEAPKLVAAIERALAAAAVDPLTPRQSQAATPPLAVPVDGPAPLGPKDIFDEAARIPAEGVITADPGDALGQTALGLDYYFGRNGRPRDLSAAAKWLLRAANNGSLAAQHNVSVMYAHGQGLRVDPLEGARWCRIAAERGDQRSQFRMSYLFFHGQGVAQDPLEAMYWAELAARQGHRGALSARDDLAAKMTPQQIAEVRHRAETFRPKG
jgi:TPR repeat protein